MSNLDDVKAKKQAELKSKILEIRAKLSLASSQEEIARLKGELAGVSEIAHEFNIEVSGLDELARDLDTKEMAFRVVGDIPKSELERVKKDKRHKNSYSDDLTEALENYEKFRSKKREKLNDALAKISDPAIILADELMSAVIVSQEELALRENLKKAQEKRDEEFQRLHKDEIDYNKKIDAIEKDIAELRHQQRSTDDRKEQIKLQEQIKAKQSEVKELEGLQKAQSKTLLSKKKLEESEKPRVDSIRAEDKERHSVLEHQVSARGRAGKEVSDLKEHQESLTKTALSDGPSVHRSELEKAAQKVAEDLQVNRSREKAATKLQAVMRARFAKKRAEAVKKEKQTGLTLATKEKNGVTKKEGKGKKTSDWSDNLSHQKVQELGNLHPDPTPAVSGKEKSRGKSGLVSK